MHDIPSSIRAFLLEPTLLSIFGIDKNQVSQVGNKIRSFKVPSYMLGQDPDTLSIIPD